MSRARHKRAAAPSRLRSTVRMAVPVAFLAAAPVGAILTDSTANDSLFAASEPLSILEESQRDVPLSRNLESRDMPEPAPTDELTVEVTEEPEPEDEPTEEPEPEDEPTEEPTEEPLVELDLTVTAEMYTTAGLNVRIGPDTEEDVLSVLARGAEVSVTATTDGEWVLIVLNGEGAWVHGDYLADEPPPPDTGISMEPCPSGSSVESGLTQDAIRVHRAVCHQFPSVTSYGGVRSGGGAHSQGRALDIMISNSATGDAIAAFVRENHSALGVSEVIWAQKIWTVERSSEGWRWMEDRGSPTANHYDHVHVTVYGNAGG